MPEVVPFTGPLPHAGKDGKTAMLLGNIIDQLHDEHGLADSGAAEEADLAATNIRSQEIYDLDPRDKGFDLGRLIREGGGRTMDFVLFLGADRSHFVHRFSDDVHDTSQRLATHRHDDLSAGVFYCLTTNKAVGGVHGDGPNDIFTEMLRDFQHQIVEAVVDGRVGQPKGVKDQGELARFELNVHNRSDDLRNLTDVLTHDSFFLLRPVQRPFSV